MQAFNVYIGIKKIDTIYYADGQKITSEEVKRSLVDHDGYDPRILVKRAR